MSIESLPAAVDVASNVAAKLQQLDGNQDAVDRPAQARGEVLYLVDRMKKRAKQEQEGQCGTSEVPRRADP